jgi:hypothetical protein
VIQISQSILPFGRKRRANLAVDRTEAVKSADLAAFADLAALRQACLYRHCLSHVCPSAPHAGAGGARSRTISDRISANICRGTATAASWKVT